MEVVFGTMQPELKNHLDDLQESIVLDLPCIPRVGEMIDLFEYFKEAAEAGEILSAKKLAFQKATMQNGEVFVRHISYMLRKSGTVALLEMGFSKGQPLPSYKSDNPS